LLVDPGDQHVAVGNDGHQPCDVPQILRTSGVQPEEDEADTVDDRHPRLRHAGERSPGDDPLLPRSLAHAHAHAEDPGCADPAVLSFAETAAHSLAPAVIRRNGCSQLAPPRRGGVRLKQYMHHPLQACLTKLFRESCGDLQEATLQRKVKAALFWEGDVSTTINNAYACQA